jgi:Rha family phage regulatory protein
MENLANTQNTLSSVEVSLLTDKQHAHVMRDIRSIEVNLANPNLDSLWKPAFYNDAQNKKRPMYLLTKKGTLLLISKYDDNIRLKVIDRWEELENKRIEVSRKDLALMVIQSEEEKERLQLQLDKQAPKINFLNRILDAEEKIDIGQAAKILELPFGRNTLFKKLREKGVFFKNRNEPRQEYVNRGYFQLKEKMVQTENREFMVIKVLVTQKGLAYISSIFGLNSQPKKEMALLN